MPRQRAIRGRERCLNFRTVLGYEAPVVAILAVAGCGTCEDFSAYNTWVDTATCLDLESGGDCTPICEAAFPEDQIRSCVLDNETDCANARVECETSEFACK